VWYKCDIISDAVFTADVSYNLIFTTTTTV